MKLKKIKSQFAFHNGQRLGILVLGIVCLGLWYVDRFVSFSETESLRITSPQFKQWQQQLDSMQEVALANKKPKVYPFNPNFISDFKGYSLGMSPIEFDRLKAFRENGKWINSAKQFQLVTKISDSLFFEIKDMFRFPEWVTEKKAKKSWTDYLSKTTGEIKLDINKATKEQLEEVYGIGEVLSQRILDKRTALGGFKHEGELYTIWGLNEEVILRILLQFEVKDPRPITQLNINTSTASDIATLPGIPFELAKRIWEFVRLREGIEDLSEVKKIVGISPRQLKVIELYLYAE